MVATATAATGCMSASSLGQLPFSPLGAKLALLSVKERDYAEELRRRTEHVDLSLDAEFQMEFGMAMMFPEEELEACE